MITATTNLDRKFMNKSTVMIAARTDGSYMIQIEDDKGVKEIELTPEEFAKAITGTLANGKTIN